MFPDTYVPHFLFLNVGQSTQSIKHVLTLRPLDYRRPAVFCEIISSGESFSLSIRQKQLFLHHAIVSSLLSLIIYFNIVIKRYVNFEIK
jgi:hypothetical protein